MESIYLPTSYRSSKNLETAGYFEKYSKMCPLTWGGSSSDNFCRILEEMALNDFSEVDLSALGASCSINKLQLPSEPDNFPIEVPARLSTKSKLDFYYPVTTEATQLNVIKCKEALEKKWIRSEFKFGSKRSLKLTITDNMSNHFRNDILPGTNFIYSILIYRPFSMSMGQKHSGEKLRFAMEIEALGTNLLSQIIDAIECVSNYGVLKEVENTKVNLKQFQNAKQEYPSQTVFIDGVFYNDTRSPDAEDYSEPVIKWAREKNIGKFTVSAMETTLLNTLTPRIGYPYVYIHQGNCEHILTFSDARLIQPNDCLVSEKYPRIVSVCRSTNVLCLICGIAPSQWLVKKCDRFPQEKVFLCTDCCNSYLYIDGKKVGDFELYPFFDEKVT
ncbi:proximal sequence element A Pbp49 [Leptinotarsa decemlineata]|uniref:proximal sequence element A Pbp49 n=1 Tax=Leptinotarsa decemlineata TaxID=7539 RepID=UPI000C252035|nr:snRNA-activating protein complex subunit 3 [Leptinotarsa decemlineata]